MSRRILGWERKRKDGPTQPPAPTASVVTTTSLTVTGIPMASASNYVFERSLAPAGPWTQISSGMSLSIAQTGLTPDTVYYYRYSYSIGESFSIPSNSLVVTTLATSTPPADPTTAPTATATSSTTVDLSWAAVTGAGAYILQRSLSATTGFTNVITTPLRTYVDDNLTPSTTYYYRYAASNADGTSGYSPTRQTTTPSAPTGGPATPVIGPAIGNVAANSIALSITTIADADEYIIQRSPNGTSSWVERYRGTWEDTVVDPPPDGTTFTVSMVSDIHVPGTGVVDFHTAGFNRIAAINSDYLGIAGDSTVSGGTDQFNWLQTLLGARKSRTFAVPGNHDWMPGNLNAYHTYYGSGSFKHQPSASVPWYSFDLNGWHFICLSVATTADGAPPYSAGSPQYQWVEADLLANSGKPIFAMWHVPRFSEDTSHGDDANVAPMWELLRSYECDIIYNGHVHSQQRFPPMTGTGAANTLGPVEFTSSGFKVYNGGASSVALPPDYQNHTNPAVVEFTFGPTSYSWKFIRVSDGVVQDSGTKAVHNPISDGGGGGGGSVGTLQSFVDTGLTAGTTYYYRYAALNVSGQSEWSPVTSGRTSATSALKNVQPVSGYYIRQRSGVSVDSSQNAAGDVYKSANAETVVAAAAGAGFGYIRGMFDATTAPSWAAALRTHNMKWLMTIIPRATTNIASVVTNQTIQQTKDKVEAIKTTYSDVCVGLEGLNEPNYNAGGTSVSSTWAQQTVDQQKAIWDQAKSTLPNGSPSPIKNVLIVGPSLHDMPLSTAGNSDWTELKGLQIELYQNMASVHSYPEGSFPTSKLDVAIDNDAARLEFIKDTFGEFYPVACTEWGYHNAFGYTAHRPVTKKVAGIYAARGYLQTVTTVLAKTGDYGVTGAPIPRNMYLTYFEGMDDPDSTTVYLSGNAPTPAHVGELTSANYLKNFGMRSVVSSTTSTWANKPVHTYVADLLTALKDPSTVTSDYLPVPVRCVVTPRTTGAKLQWQVTATKAQSDAGTATLWIWRDLSVWNRDANTGLGAEVTVATVVVDVEDAAGTRALTVGGTVIQLDIRATANPPANPFDLAVIADMHLGEVSPPVWDTQHAAILARVNAINPDYLVNVGDTADSSLTAEYNVYKNNMTAWKVKTLVCPGESDQTTATAGGEPSGRPYLPYTADSFFKGRADDGTMDVTKTNAMRTWFKSVIGTDVGQPTDYFDLGGLVANPYYWGTPVLTSQPGDPIWRLSGAVPAVITQYIGPNSPGFHAPANLDEQMTGSSDGPFMVIDMVSGFTVFAANGTKMTGNVLSVSSAGLTFHSSNGLSQANPLSDDNRNFTSRGRISNSMSVTPEMLSWAIANDWDLGYVLHLFWTQTGSGFCHPMTKDEGDRGGWGLEGQRLRLSPSVNVENLATSPGGKVIARTMQRYGLYIGDNAGSGGASIHVDTEGRLNDMLAEDDLKPIKIDMIEVIQNGWTGTSSDTVSDLTDWWTYFGTGTAAQGTSKSTPYWSKDIEGWHIISLTAYEQSVASYSESSAQYAWANTDLTNNTKPVLAIWHHPRFSRDTTEDKFTVKALHDLMVSHNVEIIVNGNGHLQQRNPRVDGSGVSNSNAPVSFQVSPYKAGTLKSPVTSSVTPNFIRNIAADRCVLKLTLSPGSYSWEYQKVTDGTVLDSGNNSTFV
jgi:predicted MPP superfamily phosphohydrolase